MPRHQPSTIDMLPPDVKEKLQELLRDPRVTQLAATEKINKVLAEEGHEERVTKSSVNRYAMRMESVGAKLRQSREIAQMWIGRLGAEPQGEVGKLLNEMVRSLAFEATMQMAEGDAPIEPKMLRDMAIAIEKLEKAASENIERDEKIRKQERERAAETAAKIAKKGGLSVERVNDIRNQILGVK